MIDPRLVAELAALDRALAARDVALWIGAEPTFTRRRSSDPWWLWQADVPAGEDKLRRACALAALLARAIPGARAERVAGRDFPGEPAPRFCIGVRAPRAALAGRHPLPAGDPLELDEVPALCAAAPAPVAPLDADQAWLTVTPDPGVVEVNTAPCPDLVSFADHLADVAAAAARVGLDDHRHRYNGDRVDSGGGGQLTLGGATPAASPFFRYPALLPRLIRYLNDHPSLSYWFAGECLGSASQAPRPDEGTREHWEELGVACAWLEREAERGRVDATLLDRTLAPLLVDTAGNSHRAELNVEKLWSPARGERGTLGLVELRAFRMAGPEAMAAAAALFRAVAARCALAPYPAPMIDWGGELHDRWSLPVQLRADLIAVLADLADHGLGPGPAITERLLGYRAAPLYAAELPGPGPATVTVSRALEFWPLLADVASQERATARTVDASSERLELTVAVPPGAPLPRVHLAGRPAALHRCPADGPADGAHRHAVAVRRRAYQPEPGLHPGLPADEPLVIEIDHGGARRRLRWYGWRPGGGPYDGLPADGDEAAGRVAERLVIDDGPAPAGATAPPPPDPSPAPPRWTVDLRLARPAPGEQP